MSLTPIEKPTDDSQVDSTAPTLPWEEYDKFLGLRSQVQSFYKFAESSFQPTVEQVAEFITLWNQNSELLDKAMFTVRRGKEKFFYINLPFELLAIVVETLEELKSRGFPGLEATIDRTISVIADYVDECGTILSNEETFIKGQINHTVESALKAILMLISYGNKHDAQRSKAMKYLEEIIAKIIPGLQPQEDKRYDLQLVVPLLFCIEHANVQLKKDVSEKLVEVITSKSGSDVLRLFSPLHSRSRKYVRNFEIPLLQLISTQIMHYGVDFTELVDKWLNPRKFYNVNQGYEFREQSIPQTLTTLSRLEAARPNATKVLHEKFGLTNFFWYPLEMLLSQFDNREDLTKRYGLIWIPMVDQQNWTKASIPAIQQLFNKIGTKYNMRFFEAPQKYGRTGVLHRLRDFHEKYFANGQGHRIDFLIVIAHSFQSATDTIHFGKEWNASGYLRAIDLLRARAHLLKNLFTEHLDIVMASCKVKGSFQTIVERVLGAAFFSSSEEVGKIEKFEIHEEGDRLRIVPIFTEVIRK